MKKIHIQILSAVILAAILVGCTGNAPSGNADDKTTQSGDHQEITTSDTSAETADKEDGGEYDAYADDMNKRFAALVDTSKYKYVDYREKEGNLNLITYYRKTENRVSPDFDYKVKLVDGTVLTLPITYEEMSKTGWVTTAPANYAVSNKVGTAVTYTDKDEKYKIVLITQNLNDSDSEKTIPLSLATYYKISFDVMDLKNNINEDVSPFTICNGITNESTFEDVLSILNAPESVQFDLDDDKIMLFYEEEVGDWYSHLTLYFRMSGKRIQTVTYEYSILDIK